MITYNIIEDTIIDLKIMCLSKHICLMYFRRRKSYQEILSESKFVLTIFCSSGPFTNNSSLNRHITFVGLSHYGTFPNIPPGICTS